MASGLLIILVGKATKLAAYIPGDPKVYEGSICLGVSTDSMDMEGKVVFSGRFDGGPEEVKAAMLSLQGEMEQLPPMYSAAKYRGKPLYSYARRGEVVPRRARKVSVYRADMTAFRGYGSRAECDFLISCSPGFYVRDFAARIGGLLGCGAALSRLRRLSSGPFRAHDALPLHEVAERYARGETPVLGLDFALQGYRRVTVKEEGIEAVRNGAAMGENAVLERDEGVGIGETVAVMTPGRDIIALHQVVEVSPYSSRPRRVL
jgi:tRNA pseudouridine55 synthase